MHAQARKSRTASRVAFVLIVLAVPLTALAQPAGKVHRVGILSVWPFSSLTFTRQFPEALRELGYVEGRHVLLDWRSADGKVDRLDDLAAELVRAKADVIVALTNPEIAAAKRATTRIPIIMVAATEPVASGLVRSLARPGANVTGGTWLNAEGAPKLLEVLKDTVPKIARVAYLFAAGEDYPGGEVYKQAVQTGARALGLTLQTVEVRRTDDVARVLEDVRRWRPDALYVVPIGNLADERDVILEFSAKHRLPAIYTLRGWVNAGGLMVYTPSPLEASQRAARYVDRVLRGARPADLPVEQPQRFDFAINLKTAEAMGLTIPPAVLLRAELVQ